MKTHLFLDLDKIKVCTKDIPFKHARVALFAPFKMAKKLITPDEPHSIYVLPQKRAVTSMVAAVKEILQHDAHVKIAIVSPRKKWQIALKHLQTDFPQTQFLLKNRLGKKVRQFVKAPLETPETIDITTIANNVQAAVNKILPKPEVFTLLTTTEPINEPDISTALVLLKKNRPKKQNDLVKLLSGSLKQDDASVQQLVSQLQKKGIITIDNAQNVRYK